LDDIAEGGVPGYGLFPRLVFLVCDGFALLFGGTSGITIGMCKETMGIGVTFVPTGMSDLLLPS
jgi:hypothetical protein